MTDPSATNTVPSSPWADQVRDTPVPDADVIACAKPNCPRCDGRGELRFHAGGDRRRKVLCPCARRRFVEKEGRRVVMDGKGRLFYREPASEVPGPSSVRTSASDVAEVPVPQEAESPASRVDQFRPGFERLATMDGEIAEIDAAFAGAKAELAAELDRAKRKFDEESKRRSTLEECRALGEIRLREKAERVRLLEDELAAARDDQTTCQLALEDIERSIAGEHQRLLPYTEAASLASARVDEHKKIQRAKKPVLQRRESLLKRLACKATSLGTTIDILARKAGVELPRPAPGDRGEPSVELADAPQEKTA